jgi:hypothetical protein
MITNNVFRPLAVLTPSRITTAQRYGFARASMDSLLKRLDGAPVSVVVVHDSPGWKNIVPKPLRCLNRQLRWDGRAKEIYAGPAVTWVDGEGRGSAAALLLAVKVALAEGKRYGFIHLDDHVYGDHFRDVLTSGLRAMEDRPNLLWTRFSGYPVMYESKVPLVPNSNNQIVFDGVTLSPLRHEDFTVWSSALTKEVNSGRYWPIAMWFCIYRLSVLGMLLDWAVAEGTKHLAHVELYFKNGVGFQRLLDASPDGSFGYINMQFGGIEMHRNKNWEMLLSMPNDPIR